MKVNNLNIVTVTMNDPKGLACTFSSIEPILGRCTWIVINGGDKIDANIRDKWPKTADIRLLEEHDEGISDAFNKGLRLISAGWVWFLNSGDEAHDPNGLIDMLDQATPSFANWLSFNVRSSCYAFRSDKRSNSNYMLDCARVPHQGQIYHMDLIGERLYDLSLKLRMDLDFHYQLLCTGARPTYVNRTICAFQGGGVTEERWFKMIIEGFKVDLKYSNGVRGTIRSAKHFAKSIAGAVKRTLGR